MSFFSRRDFLKQIGAIATVFLANKASFSQTSEPFEMLVVGDSLVWGQGLLEEQKTYSLIRNWLKEELFEDKRSVNLKVKAHSGSTIFLRKKDTLPFEKSKKIDMSKVDSEVSVSFPTISSQIEAAKIEYIADGKSPNAVNLIILSGGIVDITVASILNPFGDNKSLKKDIAKYCNEDMFRLLENAANDFPNAIFVVVGYFPILSKQTPSSNLLNDMLEAFSFPRLLKPIANNPLSRQLFKPLRKKSIKRSQIWFEDSTRELAVAVNRVNEKLGKQTVIFVKSPITDENALETNNTLLFRMGEKGVVNDQLYQKRREVCKTTLENLKRETGFDESPRRCEIAAIGHPNVSGAKAYAESIKESLNQIFAR
jgi:hypothetical protein